MQLCGSSLVAQTVKCLSTMRQNQVQPLGWEDPLEKEMAIHSHGQRSLVGYSPWGHKDNLTFKNQWVGSIYHLPVFQICPYKKHCFFLRFYKCRRIGDHESWKYPEGTLERKNCICFTQPFHSSFSKRAVQRKFLAHPHHQSYSSYPCLNSNVESIAYIWGINLGFNQQA